MPSLDFMDGLERSGTPPGLTIKSEHYDQDNSSPVPASVMSSNVSPDSSADYMGTTVPNPFAAKGYSSGAIAPTATESPSWDNFGDDASANVPRVVSSLLPASSGSLEDSFGDASGKDDSAMDVVAPSPATTTVKGKGGTGAKPPAARRRQSAKAKADGNGDPTTHRRQKRLERNRESARLSRRRRKQYLEVLEERVTQRSQEMDIGRRQHVAKAVSSIKEKRAQLLANGFSDVLNTLRQLQTGLSRTSQEMMVTSTFQSQQLKSFALPPSTKFIMWLTLQTDAFFRGGRAPSERLSAARIGERMLNSGTDTATPVQSMWPLLCSEVGLSYEQEEKVRTYQRLMLQKKESWLDRHTAFACGKTMESAHAATQAITLRFGQRSRSTMGILTEDQQMKFLSWAQHNRARVADLTRRQAPQKVQSEKYQTSPSHHVAGNLYVLNDRLQNILKTIPRAAPLVTGVSLKKLSRRPSFESLGCSGDKKEDGLSREKSFSSTGSLKRSASEMSMEGGDGRPSIPSIDPQEAQNAAASVVDQVLGEFKEIIPPPPTPSVVSSLQIPIPAPTPVSKMKIQQPAEQARPEASSVPSHERKPSFLPPHLGGITEEMWPSDAADDFLMNLEDWAIGEGIDMEMGS